MLGSAPEASNTRPEGSLCSSLTLRGFENDFRESQDSPLYNDKLAAALRFECSICIEQPYGHTAHNWILGRVKAIYSSCKHYSTRVQ